MSEGETKSETRRSTDNVIMKMAGDIGYIRSKVETITTASDDHEERISAIEDNKNTARGFFIGAAVIAGSTGSAIHTIIASLLEHMSP